MKFNFGEEDFKFPPKDGYVGLCKAPEGSVVKSQHSGRLDFYKRLLFLYSDCITEHLLILLIAIRKILNTAVMKKYWCFFESIPDFLKLPVVFNILNLEVHQIKRSPAKFFNSVIIKMCGYLCQLIEWIILRDPSTHL